MADPSYVPLTVTVHDTRADDVPLSPGVFTPAQKPQPAAPVDAGNDFNPLAMFLAATPVAPATEPPSQPEPAPVAAPEPAAPCPVVPEVAAPDVSDDDDAPLDPFRLLALLKERGHDIYVKLDKLIVTNASELTDDDRALIKEHKAALLVVAPLLPAPEQKQSLVQFLGEAPPITAFDKPADWRLEMPPDLHDDDKELFFDGEFSGLKWYDEADMCGFSLRNRSGSFRRYIPFAHRGTSENLPAEQVKRWCEHNLRGRYMRNANTRIDIHFFRTFGIDLADMDNRFGDVMHYAALLDDHRKRFALNVLSKDYLGREKVGLDLDPTRMAHYEPWTVAARALGDVDTVVELCDMMWPLMDKEDLHRVRELEEDVIPVVCELEKNGVLLDAELLHEWNRASEQHYYAVLKDISREVGFAFDGSDGAFIRLFEKFSLPFTYLDSGKPTFKDEVLERIDHPVVKTARFAAQLDSLRSKIYKPYCEMVGADGIMRVEFNQLRGDQGGTVSGRFSAGYIQQVPNKDNHRAVFGDLYDPRQLFVSSTGIFASADAEQIEYRIFASLAANPKILQAYKDDPWLNFHKYMYPIIKVHAPADFSYTNQKQCNFMRMYGGQNTKTAVMMKHITQQQADEIKATKTQRTSPLLDRARQIEKAYEREVPEIDSLLKRAMHLAMPECDDFCKRNDKLHRQYKHRGYVKTESGRRSRFPNEWKIHKALNGVIQGTAADINKRKLVEVWKMRKALGILLRITNHDEIGFDTPSVEVAAQVEAQLNEQTTSMKVPILWAMGTGKNWAEAKG